MTEKELGQILCNVYKNAPRNEVVLQIDLFGIEYAEAIRTSGCLIKDIVKSAEIKPSYATEISKGMKLADYVALKKRGGKNNG